MSDGAAQGVSATRALDTILGGAEQPADEEKMSVAEMLDKLLAAPPCTDPAAMAGYGECAESVAGEILRWAYANPDRYANTPAETEITWPEKADGSGKDYNNPIYGRRGLYDVLKDDGIALDTLGITGFQWGWAYNAARRCLELPPVQNPAIVELG